jgi:DEAD/DEAH box helicase domain-containing protein
MIYSRLPIYDNLMQDSVVIAPYETDEWAKIRDELFDDEAIALAQKLKSMNIKVPSTIGYELINSSGEVIAECEMAWETEKVAALLDEQIDSMEIFEDDGWIVFTINDDVPIEIKGGIN